MMKTEEPVGREHFYSIWEWEHFTTGPHAEKAHHSFTIVDQTSKRPSPLM